MTTFIRRTRDSLPQPGWPPLHADVALFTNTLRGHEARGALPWHLSPFFPCCLSLSHSHITFRGGFFFCLFPTKRCFGPISEDHFVHLATRFLRCWTLVSVAALVGLLLRQSSKQAPPQRRRSRTRRFTAVQKLLIVACIILLPGAAGGGNVGDGQRLSQRRVHRAKDGPRPGQRSLLSPPSQCHQQ